MISRPETRRRVHTTHARRRSSVVGPSPASRTSKRKRDSDTSSPAIYPSTPRGQSAVSLFIDSPLPRTDGTSSPCIASSVSAPPLSSPVHQDPRVVRHDRSTARSSRFEGRSPRCSWCARPHADTYIYTLPRRKKQFTSHTHLRPSRPPRCLVRPMHPYDTRRHSCSPPRIVLTRSRGPLLCLTVLLDV